MLTLVLAVVAFRGVAADGVDEQHLVEAQTTSGAEHLLLDPRMTCKPVTCFSLTEGTSIGF